MKLSKRDINLLLGFLGILIAFLSYQFAFVKMNESAEKLSNQSAAMESEIAKLQALVPQREHFETETARMEKEINAWLAQFDTNVLPEDDMKFAYQQDNRNSNSYLFINSLSFTEPSLLYTTNTNTAVIYDSSMITVTGGSLYPTYYLYGEQTSYGLECAYDGLKSIVKSVFAEDNRKGIENITLAFDETTGQLSGNMVMNSYFVLGLDKTYVQPSLTPVRQGTDNIFGTVENRILEDEVQAE